MANLLTLQVTDLIDDVLAAQYNKLLGSIFRPDFANVLTMTGTLALTDIDMPIQNLNCNGANRIVTLPAFATTNHEYFIVNATAATYTLDVQTSGGVSVLSAPLQPGQAVLLVPDGVSKHKQIGWVDPFEFVASDIESTTMTGTVTLADTNHTLQSMNCNGVNRIVKLPPFAVTNHAFLIFNATGAAFTLDVQSNAGVTLLPSPLTNGQYAMVVPDGSAGFRLVNQPAYADMFKSVYDPAAIAQQLVGTTATQTLTNKRITKRVQTLSGTTLTPATDTNDVGVATGLAAATTIGAPTGTPTDFQSYAFRLKDNGTAQTLSWNAAWRGIAVSLPSTTVAGKWLYIAAVYNATDAIWDVTVVQEQ